MLRENPGGVASALSPSGSPRSPAHTIPNLAVADFKKQIEVQPHRLNECLTALVRAKLVLKVVAKVRYQGGAA